MKKRYWIGALSALAGASLAAKLWLRPRDIEWSTNRDAVFHADYSRFAEVHGARIHYQEAGASDAQPLLLIHGFASSNLVWSKVLLKFADRGFRVIAPDLLGYGYSEKPQTLDYTITSQAKMVAGLIRNLGLEKLFLLGSSYG
ncbi:MAG TPA: alpha/beta fold hydrolase, partial [Pyrinomonadaceae bacterium]|nr:alpha/beta fold hydrolase [Pyrinomonadaceae bacterium]